VAPLGSRRARLGFIVATFVVAGLASGSAVASTFGFGASVWRSDLSTVSLSGDAEDRSASQFSFAFASNANFRAQASADVLLNETAVADALYVWDVPYTVTRNVSISGCCPAGAQAVFPLQTVAFTITFSGAVGVDDGSGLEMAEIFDGISVMSTGGLFTATSFDGDSRTDLDGVTSVSDGTLTGYDTTVNFTGAGVGEITFTVPTDYQSWVDFLVPQALDYSVAQNLVQSYTDTLRVSMRLRAESSSPDIFTPASEALACAGLQSTLGSFDLVPNCGSGLSIAGAVGIFDYESILVAVPEPTTALLVVTGLAAAAAQRRRRR
jgi:hypothetical protein